MTNSEALKPVAHRLALVFRSCQACCTKLLNRSDEGRLLDGEGDGQKSQTSPWQPGFKARLPWGGLGALFLVVLLTGASVVVLILSNGKRVDSWSLNDVKVQPQVLLSILSTIMNAVMSYALIEGIAVFFWRQAGRGTTLQALHDSYESIAVLSALETVVRGTWNVAALGSILAMASTMRGPLFQRASVIGFASLEMTGSVNISAARFLPPNYFQRFVHDVTPTISPEVRQIVDNINAKGVHYKLGNVSCANGCEARVQAAGFKIDCEARSTTVKIDLDEGKITTGDPSASCSQEKRSERNKTTSGREKLGMCGIGAWGDPRTSTATFFSVGHSTTSPNLDRNETFHPETIINATFKDGSTCDGSIQSQKCTLRQGIVEYVVTLADDTISLRHPHWQNDTYLHDAPKQEPYQINWASVLVLLYPAETVNMSYYYGEEGPGKLPNTEQFVDCGNNTEANIATCFISKVAGGVRTRRPRDTSAHFSNQDFRHQQFQSPCNYSWRDPMQEMLNNMREFAFRASFDAASFTNRSVLFTLDSLNGRKEYDVDSLTSDWNQQIKYNGTNNLTVYKLDSTQPFIYLAVAASLLGVLGLLPLYYGWWDLGRSVSLNPLETAKAFEAPLLKEVNSNAKRSKIVKVVGKEQVRYGVLEEKDGDESTHRLRIELDQDDRVASPKPGSAFM